MPQVLVRANIGSLTLLNSEIESLEVDQQLGHHTTCDLEFVIGDISSKVKLEALIDQDIVVTVQEDMKGVIEIFQGRVVDGSQTHMADRGNRYILQAVSPSIRHERTTPAYFGKSKLATIAGNLGIRIKGTALDLPQFDHVQWGETEFSFLRRLADEAGLFMVTTGPSVELRNEFESKDVTLRFGEDVVALTSRMRPTNNTVAGANYDPAGKHSHYHAGVRQTPEVFSGATDLLTKLAQIAPKTAGGGDRKFEPPAGRAADQTVFRNTLKHESERALGTAATIELTTAIPGVLAGDLVTVRDSSLGATQSVSGELGVIRAKHIFREQHYSCEVVGTGWKKFTAADPPERPIMDGPTTAEVVSNEDPEKLGRVQIKYRWQDQPTNWARVAVLYAGNGRGTYFIPEVGDEVLVQFESGDPERPIVTGCLWNGKDRPPEPMEKNDAKRIITKSGNTIQLLDTANEETIEIFTKEAKCMIQLTNKGGKPCITVHSSGDIAFEADGQIRFKCESLLQDVKADALRKIGGDDSTDVSGAATIKAGGDAGLAGLNVTIKGGVNVDSIAGAVNNVIGTMVHLQPPGYMGKPVMAKPATVQKTDLGQRKTPEVAEPKRTTDALTPRT